MTGTVPTYWSYAIQPRTSPYLQEAVVNGFTLRVGQRYRFKDWASGPGGFTGIWLIRTIKKTETGFYISASASPRPGKIGRKGWGQTDNAFLGGTWKHLPDRSSGRSGKR